MIDDDDISDDDDDDDDDHEVTVWKLNAHSFFASLQPSIFA
jgi:hypothetical protein